MHLRGRLILLRHAQSVWNKNNVFTGWVNIGLSQEGIKEALKAGGLMEGISFDVVYVSELIRSQMTAFLALSQTGTGKTPTLLYKEKAEYASWHDVHAKEMQSTLIPVFATSALNERYYGKLQGKNKDEIKNLYGEEQFKLWRRSYEVAPPEGESLKMTIERTLPYFDKEIVPRLEKGETVLICAHGNSLRGIVMEIEGLSESEVASLEIPTGVPLEYIYENQKWQKGVKL